MQLIDNWKQALSMTSVQAGGAIAALGINFRLCCRRWPMVCWAYW
jgi:hypothetical protein